MKAFRCGEYDACIETAKATASGKKPVKYARREDAIVHALEIENALLLVGKDDSCVDKASTSSDSTDGKASKVQPLSEKRRRRRRTPNDSEDDERNKRMRGLEDIGVGVGSKEKAKQENGLVSDVDINANESSKKKTQRRPLTKVLESTTAVVSVPVTCDELVNSDCPPGPGLSESKVSAVNNSDSNGVVSCENDDVSLNATENFADVRIHNKAKESEVSSISVLAKDEVFDVPLLGEHKYTAGIDA